MKAKKQAKIAKVMFKNSLDSSGYVTSPKVKAQIDQITKTKPQGLTRVLKAYKRLIETAIAKEEIIVESASEIAGQKKIDAELLLKTGAKKITHKVNPNIVLGARIRHGDWIWDETLDSKLEHLTTDI